MKTDFEKGLMGCGCLLMLAGLFVFVTIVFVSSIPNIDPETEWYRMSPAEKAEFLESDHPYARKVRAEQAEEVARRLTEMEEKRKEW